MFHRSRPLLALIFTALLPLSGQAATASGLGLGDALQAALERNVAADTPVPFTASSWLAALPSIDVSYLRSEEQLGTDETEVGLNLPLKSPFLREQDARLRALGEELAEAEVERRRLYYSGLVREAAWSAHIAMGRLEQAEQHIALLEQLREREESLLSAHATTRYGLLLLRQELVEARLQIADQRAEHRHWLDRFRNLTGLATLPAGLDEPAPGPTASWHRHPTLRLLDIGWQQQQALIAASSGRAAPWNLRLGAKRLENVALDEMQYGVAVEIPIGALGWADEASRSNWQEAARSYGREQDQLRTTLAQSWQRLQLEAAHLETRQSLLEEAAAISAELKAEAEILREQNELGREVWIARLMADLKRQSEVVINRLLIGQNHAMSRQAAGIPL